MCLQTVKMNGPARLFLGALLLPGFSAAQQPEVFPRTAATVELNPFNLDVVVTDELEIESAGPEARVCVGIWDEKGNEAGFAVVKPSGS